MTRNALERALAFAREHEEESCSHSEPWKWGTALFHQALPLVYDLNFLRFESSDDVTASELAAEADAVMGERVPHRQIVVQDEAAGKRLTAEFKDLGWKADRHVVMVHRRPPDKDAETDTVQEVGDVTVWPAREQFLRTYEWCRDDETVAQMHAAYRIWMRAGGGRDFAVLSDGKPVSFAMLWMRDGIGQIEDVATLTEFRNRGFSRAVVLRTIAVARDAGCELIFLIADEQDWPKELYRRLGFDPVGRTSVYLKTPS